MGAFDIAAAFKMAAPGVILRECRMRYDNQNNKQIIELDIVDGDGARTIKQEFEYGASTALMKEAIKRAAEALHARVVENSGSDDPVETTVDVPEIQKAHGILAPVEALEALEALKATKLTEGQTMTVIKPAQEGLASQLLVGDVISPGGKIERDGEVYELAHDGRPNHLFF